MRDEFRKIAERTLPNGLTVYFYDRSRPLAGGRWQVQLLVSIPVQVKEQYILHHSDAQELHKTFLSIVGETIYFEQEKIRQFVAQDEVAVAIEAMIQEFVRHNAAYTGRADFAQRFVAKKYQEWETEEKRKRLQAEAIRRAQRGE